MTDCNELRPYELLIRWDELTGEIKGAAFYQRKVTVMGGEVIRNELQGPQAVDLGDGALAAVLDEAAASALATVARLEAVIQARDKEVLDLKTADEGKAATIAQLEAAIAQLEAAIAAQAPAE